MPDSKPSNSVVIATPSSGWWASAGPANRPLSRIKPNLFIDRPPVCEEFSISDYCRVRSLERCTSNTVSSGAMSAISATVISSQPSSL